MLCHIVAHRDHFVVCLSGSHTFLVVTHSCVSQTTYAFSRNAAIFVQFIAGKFKENLESLKSTVSQ